MAYFAFCFLLHLVHFGLSASTSPSIHLCCPPSQVYTQSGLYQGDRCQDNHQVQRKCQPYQEELPEWSEGDRFGLVGGEFSCKGGAVLVPVDGLFGPQEFRLTDDGVLHFKVQDIYNNMTEVVTYNSSDFCLMFTDIPDYDYGEEGTGEENTETLHETYSVCYKEEEREEVEKQRVFTGIFYPTAIIISDFFILITIIIYLFVNDMRKKLFGKITIGFLLNVFICYTFLGIHYSLDLFSHDELVDTVFCKVIGYIIQHSFIGFFFWMSAMAFNITYTFTQTYSVRRSQNQFKTFLLNICYAQGCPLIITCVTAVMDFYGPCDYILPNMGRFTCFLGSEYSPDRLFFRTPEFLYFYLIISIIMVTNIICFIITGTFLISHWAQMKDLNSSLQNDGLKKHFGIVFKLFIIMGIPWTCDIISAAVEHAYGDTGHAFEIRLSLDIMNLLTGVLIFLVLVCKQQVMQGIKSQLSSSSSSKTVISSSSSADRLANSNATGGGQAAVI